MHPTVLKEFERICAAYHHGDSVLEIGAVPSGDSLLALKAFAGARIKVGVNLEGPCRGPGFEIIQRNANDLSLFADASFDTVVSNATLEHDPFFWRTISEMKRVLRPQGLLVIGVPGYARLGLDRLLSGVDRLNPLRSLFTRRATSWGAATLTLRVHEFPGDYYRFSLSCMRDVLLADLEDLQVRTVLIPPRIIGKGIKPR